MSIWNRRWIVVLGGVLVLGLVVGLATRWTSPTGGESGGQDVPAAHVEEQAGPEVAGVGAADPPQADQAPSAVIVLPSTPATQWGELVFSAEGFQPGEEVSLLVDHEGEMEEIARAEANARGDVVDASTLLPSWLESGKHDVLAVGTSSGVEASGTLPVRAKELWINLESYTLRQADNVGFVAGGFEPGDRITAYLTQDGDSSSLAGQEPLATASADEIGNTEWIEAPVPMAQPGEYTLLLKGESTTEELSAAVTVEPLRPELELSPWAGLPGRKVDLNARGFLPGEEVEVFVGGSKQPAATYEADQYGGLWGAGPIVTPTNSVGESLPIMLRGKRSGAEVTANFGMIAPHPWAELNNYSGFAGTPVMVHGGGFAVGEPLTLHVGSASSPPVARGVANDVGNYRGLGPAQVPDDANGEVTFVVVGENSGTQAEATFKLMKPIVPELPERP